MSAYTFEAEVLNGQLFPAEPLRAFEGQRVQITVAARDPLPKRAQFVAEDEGADAPDDLDVEKVVYAPMPFPNELLPNPKLIDQVVLQPCLIVPEDLPDA